MVWDGSCQHRTGRAGSGSGEQHEPGKDAETGVGGGKAGVRLYPAGLYALAGDAHHQRTGGGRRCPDSGAGAVPVRKRSGTAFTDRPKGSAADQPEVEN